MRARDTHSVRRPGRFPSTGTSVQVLALASAALLAACNDDDDGGGTAPLPEQSTFSAFLDESEQVPAPIEGTRVRVSFTNRAPETGTYLMPVWFAFHDGTFDVFDVGSSADAFFPQTNALEPLVESGTSDALETDFTASGAGLAQGAASGELGFVVGPIAPGETVSAIVELDRDQPQSRFFSYVAMVAPSNDAFVANDDPMAHPIFDAGGSFVATDFTVVGADVLDAGTEVNDEDTDTLALFQSSPDAGTAEGGLVAPHPGFLAPGSGGVLDDARFADADFTAVDYTVLTVAFEELPAAPPATAVSTIALVNGDSRVTYRIAGAGLSGPITGASLNRGTSGTVGPVLLDLSGDVVNEEDGTFLVEGTQVATPDVAMALRDGNVYVQLGTALNPLGELRGQATLDEVFSGTLTTQAEVPAPRLGTSLRVTVRNAAPANGTWLSPVWVGLHDGTVELFDLGGEADLFFPGTDTLERLAEAGHTTGLEDEWAALVPGASQAVLVNPVGPGAIPPGQAVSAVLRVDATAAQNRFLSYALEILPSNDAFLANDDPMAHPVFDAAGNFIGMDFVLSAADALDAGTEVNDELPQNTSFFGQTVPDSGVDENGNVALHPGFAEVGTGGILDDPMFAGADFTSIAGYEFARFELSATNPTRVPSGFVAVRLNEAETEGTFRTSVSDLSGPARAMHFHEGLPGVAGPIVVDLGDTLENLGDGDAFAEGTFPVDAAFLSALRAGRIYLNVHTDLNPTGEVRGQVLEQP